MKLLIKVSTGKKRYSHCDVSINKYTIQIKIIVYHLWRRNKVHCKIQVYN